MSISAHGGSVPPRILVVDDAPAIRAALRALLKDAGFVVVGEAGDGDQGVAMAVPLAPDFVVMDLRTPTWAGWRRAAASPPPAAAPRCWCLGLRRAARERAALDAARARSVPRA